MIALGEIHKALINFEMIIEDEDGNETVKTFPLPEEVIDYIQQLESMLYFSQVEAHRYRDFYCDHFASMVVAN